MGIFWRKKEEIREGCGKLCDEVYTLYSSLHITVMIKWTKKREAEHVALMEKMRSVLFRTGKENVKFVEELLHFVNLSNNSVTTCRIKLHMACICTFLVKFVLFLYLVHSSYAYLHHIATFHIVRCFYLNRFCSLLDTVKQ